MGRLVELQAMLGRVARDIGPALELKGVLQTVLTGMRSLVDFRGGTIQLVDDRGVYIAAADPEVSAEVLASRVPIGQGISGRVISTGESVYSPDLQNDDRVDPELAARGSNSGIRSYLAVPLVVMGSVIGAMQIDSEEVDAFDEDDLTVMEGLAMQVAGAIESARRREEILELERMKADFIARISHELRTPLTVMSGFTDTLLNLRGRLNEEQQVEVLHRIKTSVTRLQMLIEEILGVTSLDAGMSRVEPEDVDLCALLADARHLSIDDSRVTVHCAEGTRIVSDPVILRHVVNQLIDNALKYGGDAVVTGGRDDDGRLVLEVRDHGPGVAEADRERIFQRFFRGNHTGAGMGLGLPVVRQLAASLDATVEVDDAPGGGARFTLRFNA